MADNKVNSGLLEFSEDQKVFIALDAETSEVEKAVVIDGDGVETDITGGGGSSVTVEALSVTENGTYSEEGKAYSPVTVNVEAPASDFSTAEVEFSQSGGSGLSYSIKDLVFITNNNDIETRRAELSGSDTATYTLILYKGKYLIPFENVEGADTGTMPTVSGGVELTEDGILITEDGTFSALGT